MIENYEIKEINIKDTTFPAFSTVIRGFLCICEDYDRWTNRGHSFTEYTVNISRMIFMKNYFFKCFFGRQCLSTASLLIFQHFLQITARSVLMAIFFWRSNYRLLRNTVWHIYLRYVTVMAVHV